MQERNADDGAVNPGNFIQYLSTRPEFSTCTLIFTGIAEGDRNEWLKAAAKWYNLKLEWKMDEDGDLRMRLMPWDFWGLFSSDEGFIGDALTLLGACGKWNAEYGYWYAEGFSEGPLHCSLLAAVFD